jgi:DNA-binding MarR family transcriptional regulator
MTWYTLQSRDPQYRKYRVEIFQPTDANDGCQILFCINHIDTEAKEIAKGVIAFTRTWLVSQGDPAAFRGRLGTSGHSPLVTGMLRDELWGKSIDELKRLSESDIKMAVHPRSKYTSRIVLMENGIYRFVRDTVIVAQENRFARDLVLRTIYDLYSSQGRLDAATLIKSCHYDETAIRNAIDALVSKRLIERSTHHEPFLKLTHEGQVLAEERILTPFNDKIFLIAACDDDIYKLIEKVYDPVVRELGYTLVFQEKSEPKNSIHEDIWEYIRHCKIILCDLTNKRPNCFIEYGYALGREKPIILCVEEEQGKDNKTGMMNMPFDTLTQRYSFWRREWLYKDSEPGLSAFAEELKERIRMKLAMAEVARLV